MTSNNKEEYIQVHNEQHGTNGETDWSRINNQLDHLKQSLAARTEQKLAVGWRHRTGLTSSSFEEHKFTSQGRKPR